MCDNSNESYKRIFCSGTVSNFLSLWMNPKSMIIQMKATKQYFLVVLFITVYKVFLTFESVNHGNPKRVTIQMKTKNAQQPFEPVDDIINV